MVFVPGFKAMVSKKVETSSLPVSELLEEASSFSALSVQVNNDSELNLKQTRTRSAIRTINLHLLRSYALLANGSSVRALRAADEALSIATTQLIYHMMCKSQFYRGLCLMELQRWKEASDAFTRAANVRAWADNLAGLKTTAERRLVEELDGRHL